MFGTRPRTGEEKLTRTDALRARPVRSPNVTPEPIEGGGLRLSVSLERRGWSRWLAGGGTVRRRIELDALGREVYEACDGTKAVNDIVKAFAAAHRLSRPEAQMSVTKFLSLLMQRSLIAMVVERPEEKTA